MSPVWQETVVSAVPGRSPSQAGLVTHGWHLKRVNAATAWRHTRAAGTVVAVVDDGVDVRHPELAGRITRPFNAETGDSEVRPQTWEGHGTKVAGVIAAEGRRVSGVAPGAMVMPIRLPSVRLELPSDDEVRAIRYAAEKGADVICCAWGPLKPSENEIELPESTKQALEFAASEGRQGKGCVVLFAAGNDDAPLEADPYATHPDVIAVGACNDEDVRPTYSNFGASLWCVFPSCDRRDPDRVHTEIATTAPTGSFQGPGDRWYTDTFGLTSAATAGVAGVCALIISANPELNAVEVREILRDCCVKIDPENARYDERGHSPLYGYGRVDAARAVELALRASRRPPDCDGGRVGGR